MDVVATSGLAIAGVGGAVAAAAAALGTLVAFRQQSRPIDWKPVHTPEGSVEVVRRADLASCRHWEQAFAKQRKDARYFEIVEETIDQGFDYFYLLLKDAAGEAVGVQPFFFLDQDLLAGSGPTVLSMANRARRFFPRLLKARTLMVGCAAGEGHLDDGSEESRLQVARLLHAAVKMVARQGGARLIVLKEFHANHRAPLSVFSNNGYARVPSLPMTRLNIDYPDFETYLSKAVGKVTRKSLRRKFRVAEAAEEPITLEVVTNLAAAVDEIYPLYLQVYERSSLHFEKLTKPFFVELGRRMPDKARFFIWRQGNRAVAFSLCLVNGDTVYDEYLGLDYSTALDLHLYFYTFRDIVSWAMGQGLKWYASSALNYDPKLHFRCELVPLDLYVSHTSPWINPVLKRVLPWLEPTRNDPILREFPNFADVWGGK